MVGTDEQPEPVTPRSTVTLRLRLFRFTVLAEQLLPAVAESW